MDIQVGDIIAFEGKGLVFHCLSWLLGVFEPSWRKRKWKPWHLAVASRRTVKGWMLIEAVAGGVQERLHPIKELSTSTRAYKWLYIPPTKIDMANFAEAYLGYPYDAGAYLGIIFAYLVWKVTKKSFRVIDTEHLCWETVAAFCRFMGKPLQPIYEYPVISRIMEKLEGA